MDEQVSHGASSSSGGGSSSNDGNQTSSSGGPSSQGPLQADFEASSNFLGTYVDGGVTYYVLDAGIARAGTDGTLAVFLEAVGRPAFAGGRVTYVRPRSGSAPSVCRATLANGQADTTFGDGGCTQLPVPYLSRPKGVALLPDGGVLAVVNASCSNGCQEGEDTFAVVKLDGSGALDASFGRDGVAHPNPGEEASVESFTQQSGGALVASVTLRGYQLRLVRIDTDGVWDQTFGEAGSAPSSGAGNAIAVLADDSILLASTWNGIEDLERWTKDGQADGRFGDGGRLDVDRIHPPSNDDARSQVEALLVDGDGRIYAAGQEIDTSSSPYGEWKRPFVARLTGRGELDASFGEKGVFRNFADIESLGTTLATGLGLDADGRVVFGLYGDGSFGRRLFAITP